MQSEHPHLARLEALAAFSGILIAIQSRANGELSHRLNNSIQAAVISFSTGLLVLIVITIFNQKVRNGMRNLSAALRNGALPKWQIPAGVLGGLFVAMQTHVVPLIGVAIFSVASISGQTAVSLIVDRIGLTGGGKKPISKRRVAAATITVAAVLISVLDKFNVSTFSIAELPDNPFLIISAMSRGDLLATFANAKAIDVA